MTVMVVVERRVSVADEGMRTRLVGLVGMLVLVGRVWWSRVRETWEI